MMYATGFNDVEQMIDVDELDEFHVNDFFQSNDVISGCRSTDLNLHNYGVVMEDVVIEDTLDRFLSNDVSLYHSSIPDIHHSDSSDSGLNMDCLLSEETMMNTPSSPPSESSEGYVSDTFVHGTLNGNSDLLLDLNHTAMQGSSVVDGSSHIRTVRDSSLRVTSSKDETLTCMPSVDFTSDSVQVSSFISRSTSAQISFAGCSAVAADSSTTQHVTLMSSTALKNVRIRPKPSFNLSENICVGGNAALSCRSNGVSVENVVSVCRAGMESVFAKSGSARKLVLTEEEFAALTASGALRLELPAGVDRLSGSAEGQCISSSIQHASLESVTTCLTDSSGRSKRQQRMLKNRESATLSRRKNKEYMSRLESQVELYTSENWRLATENQELKLQVGKLQGENSTLRLAAHLPPKKLILVVVALFFTLNLSSLKSLLIRVPGLPDAFQGSSMLSSYRSSHSAIKGRHLLFVPDMAALPGKPVDAEASDGDLGFPLATESAGSVSSAKGGPHEHSLSSEAVNYPMSFSHHCPIYFNSTESSRLAEQLRGWMLRDEAAKKMKSTERFSPGNRRNKKSHVPISSLRSLFNRRKTYDREQGGADVGYPVQLYWHDGLRSKLLNAIPRRNDTFYVFSFSTDYFLFPATAHNKTLRPRISLVVPVMSEALNDTTPLRDGNVGMMQIDCEIHSTKLTSISRSLTQQPGNWSDLSRHFGNQSYPSFNRQDGSRHEDPVGEDDADFPLKLTRSMRRSQRKASMRK